MVISGVVVAALLMDLPRSHPGGLADFDGHRLWSVSCQEGARTITIPLDRQLSGFERAHVELEVFLPENAGVTGVCAKVVSWPGMIPAYEYDGKTVVMPVSPVDPGTNGWCRISCGIDLHAMLAAGTVPFPSRLDSMTLLRRADSPAATLGVGRAIWEKKGLFAELSAGNGELMVGDLDDPGRNDPHFTLINEGPAREADFTWKVRNQERAGVQTGSLRRRLAEGERVRIDLPRLTRADVVYVDYGLSAEDGERFAFAQTLSYGAMHPAGCYPRLFTDDFLFSIVCHAQFYPVEEQEVMFDYMGQAGINHCRGMPAYFGQVMPTSNSWNLAVLLDRVERAHRRGIDPQTTLLGACPAWAADQSVAKGYPRLDVMENYSERLVRALAGKVRYFETSNEMNLKIRNAKSGWTIENFAAFEKACYRGLKRGNPEARMLSGEWAGFRFGVMDYYFKHNLADYDVRAFHYHGSFESALGEAESVFKIQREAMPGKPWFADECAISVLDRDLVAGITLFQKCVHAWAHGAIGYAWYNLRNKGFNHSGEPAYGILTGDLCPRAGYLVYNALAGTMRDSKFVAAADVRKDVMAYRFERKDRDVALFPMWSMSSGFGVQSVYFRTDAKTAEWVDIFGNVESCPIDGGVALCHPGSVPGILRLSPASATFEAVGGLFSSERALVLTAGGRRAFDVKVANPRGAARRVDVRVRTPKGVTADPTEFSVEIPAGGEASCSTALSAASEFSPGAAGTTFVTFLAHGAGTDGRMEFAVEPVYVSTPMLGAKLGYARQEQYTSFVQGLPDCEGLYWGGPRDLSGKCTVDYPADENLHVWFWVNDDLHVQKGASAERLYEGDSAQLFLKFPNQGGVWEIGLARTDAGKHLTYIWNAPPGFDKQELAGRVRLKTNFERADGTGVLWYHSWIPLQAFGTSRETILKCGFRLNLMVNDNDGPRREGFISITRGNPWMTDNYPAIVFEP